MGRCCWGILLCFALLIGLPGGVAANQVTLYACIHTGPQDRYDRDKDDHSRIRIVLATEPCHRNEVRVALNQAGPPGPAGPQGPAGPPGPIGIPMPAAVIVDCDAGQTIKQALQTISGNPLKITVIGACKENVSITRDDVTLQGDPSGASITGPDASLDTILIAGARRVVIDSLTVSGGQNGIGGVRVAAFTVQRSTVQNASSNGILVENASQAVIDSTTVTGNSSNGIRVVGASNATITNTAARLNGYNGIGVSEGSSARIGLTYAGTQGGNTIEKNGNSGIEFFQASSGELYGNTIQNNNTSSTGTAAGIYAQFSSAVSLIGGNIITANVGPGIFLKYSALRASRNEYALPAVPNEISNNTGGGIYAQENSEVDVRDGITITSNTANSSWVGYGIFLDAGTRLRMQSATVSGNAPGGIYVWLASSVRFNGNTTVTGNSGFDVNCGMNGGPSYAVKGSNNALGSINTNCTPF